MPHEDGHAKPEQMLEAWLDWDLSHSQVGETPGQLAGETHERPAGETPWPLAGETPGQLAGETHERPAGETPWPLAGGTPWPLAGETPWPLAGETSQQLMGETPDRLAGGTPQQLMGETPQQLAGETPWPLAGQQRMGETPQQLAGETPWPLAGQQRMGETPQQLAGETPWPLAGQTPWPLAGETPWLLAGETSQQLIGQTPERLVGDTPQQRMGETPQQLAGETSWPLAGETPWPLLGETLEQIAGETPQQLRGDNPQQLGGDTPQQLGGDTPQQLAGDTPQQLAGETPEHISGETPEQTAGETSQQLAGEVPERLAGEAPERLAREIVKQISGETPEQIAGETSQQLVGEAPERLAGEIPEQTAGETSQQLAEKAPEPLAERPHDKPQEDPSTSDGDCEVVWTSGPTPQESRTRPYRTAASRRTPYSMPDPSRRSPYVPPDARRSAYSTPVSRQAPGRANQKQNTKGSTVRRAGPTEQNRRSTLEQEPPFCFRCEELFPSRMWLEEHPCPAMTYICSCGTEFSMYMDMVQHSREHKPGQAVLDHATIRKRRVEMQVKDQLRWMKQAPLPQISVRSPQISARYSQITVRSPQIPMRPPPVSIAPWSSPAKLPAKAPTPITVGLWALYQPVVLIDTMRSFNKANPFQCATCDQGFATKNALIRHHSAHLQEKVAGCLRCGMLLPTTRGVAKPHQCRSSNGALARTNNPTAVSLGKIVLPKVTPPSVHALYKHEASVMAHTVTAPVRAGSFRCNMCYVSFQSVKLLQKHKCPIAIDYVRRRQALMPNNQKRVNNKVIGPYALPKTNATELKVNIQAFRDIQAHHQKVAIPARASVIPARASAIPARTSAIPARASAVPAIRVNTEVDSDDDCIMIES